MKALSIDQTSVEYRPNLCRVYVFTKYIVLDLT